MPPNDSTDPSKADQYEHLDGVTEVVVAVEDGRVLTVKEYPTVEKFETAVGPATYAGRHEGVAALPGVEAFREDLPGQTDADDAERNGDAEADGDTGADGNENGNGNGSGR